MTKPPPRRPLPDDTSSAATRSCRSTPPGPSTGSCRRTASSRGLRRPRQSGKNVFNLTLTYVGAGCSQGDGTRVTGVAHLDATTTPARLLALGLRDDRAIGFVSRAAKLEDSVAPAPTPAPTAPTAAAPTALHTPARQLHPHRRRQLHPQHRPLHRHRRRDLRDLRDRHGVTMTMKMTMTSGVSSLRSAEKAQEVPSRPDVAGHAR